MSHRQRHMRRSRSKGGAGKIIMLALGVLVAGAAIAAISAVGYVVSIANSAPDIRDLKPKTQGENSIIYAADGKTRLAVIQADNLRTPIASSLMPRAIRQATVAIEDKRFYKHGGVDIEGVVRAAIKNVQSDNTVQGGSTLTMQLIKNLYTEDRTKDYKRKIREAKLAEDLEDLHPGKPGKEWILTKYLNNVPYGTVGGQTAYGIQSAARVFFAKSAHDLTLSESALLAGLPQAPTDYNPYLHPKRALERRGEVLAQMADSGYITAAQEQAAQAAPLGVKQTQYYKQRREAYFGDYVRKELIRKYGLEKVREGGLHVYTTIDLKDQQKARDAIKRSVGQPGSPAAALVSIDPRTGYIKAMASSSSYAQSKFNYASQAERQPGSTFKIIDLMTALRRNIDINKTSYVSKKLNFTWHDPENNESFKIDVNTDDGSPSGKPKSLFNAVVTSDNTVFTQLYLDLGPENVTQTAHDMGITSRLQSYPSEALGGGKYCCTVLEMARAYVSVNDGGYRQKPIAITKVVFPDGKVDRSLAQRQRKKIFTDGQTSEAIKAMEANVRSGTGTRAQLSGCTAAGKTGTTSGFKDAWFNGMTPDLNTTVWVGFPNAATPMISVPGGTETTSWPGDMFGGNAPAQIWHDFMQSVVDKSTCGTFPKPEQPFVGEPFFGEFTSGGSRGGSGSSIYDNDPTANDPDQTGTGGTTDQANGNDTGNGGTAAAGTGGTGNDDTQYPPDAYEAPPQGTGGGGTDAGGAAAGGAGTG